MNPGKNEVTSHVGSFTMVWPIISESRSHYITIYEKRTTIESSPSFILGVLSQLMDGKATAELRLEPCGLRRHDIA